MAASHAPFILCAPGGWLLFFRHVYGCYPAGQVMVPWVSEAGRDHEGLEIIAGREFQDRAGEIFVGAEL